MSEEIEYLTTTEFARRVRASANAVKLWCKSGKLVGCVKTPGGHWRIPSSNVMMLGFGEMSAVMETPATYASERGPASVVESITAKKSEITDFCRRNRIRKLALFGSVLRDDFRPDSDIDVLVEFELRQTPGLIRMAGMELELSELLDRKTDLRTKEDLNSRFRDKVVGSSEVIYGRHRAS